MLNTISAGLFLGLGLSSIMAAYQDFRTQTVDVFVWVPAILGILGYFYLVKSPQFILIELLWMAMVFGVTAYMYYRRIFGNGDIIALTLIAAAPVGLVISAFVSFLLSPKFKDRTTGKVPFVGVLSSAFLVFTVVMAVSPWYFL